MPRYGAKDVSIRLSVADLETTTRDTARNSQVKNLCRRNLLNIATEFNEASKNGTLAEAPFYLGVDKLYIQMIGEQNNMPFCVVESGQDLFLEAPKGRRNAKTERLANTSGHAARDSDREVYAAPEPETIDPPEVPLALCMSVFLSERCFTPTKQWGRSAERHIKIDVFFNGDLCNSAYVPYRFHGENHKYTEHILRFTGRRIGPCVEKPWVLLPPDQNWEKTLENTQARNAMAKSRWEAVNSALLKEAEKVGKNDTYLGKYLTSLACIPMPSEVEVSDDEDAPPLTRPYGIIDVVITAGKGAKDASYQGGFIESPTPLRLNKIKTPKPAQQLAREFTQLLNSQFLPPTPVAPSSDATLQNEAAVSTEDTQLGTPSLEHRTITSSVATPQRQVAVSTENTQTDHPSSGHRSIESSEDPPRIMDTNNGTPSQPGKRVRISEAAKQAMSHQELVKRRLITPDNILPEAIAGFGIRQHRTRTAHNEANNPQPPPPTASSGSSTAPATTPSASRRARRRATVPVTTPNVGAQSTGPISIQSGASQHGGQQTTPSGIHPPTGGKHIWPGMPNPPTGGKSFTGPSSGYAPPKKNRLDYVDVYDDHKTNEEELLEIQTKAQKAVLNRKKKSLIVKFKVNFKKSLVVKLKVPNLPATTISENQFTPINQVNEDVAMDDYSSGASSSLSAAPSESSFDISMRQPANAFATPPSAGEPATKRRRVNSATRVLAGEDTSRLQTLANAALMTSEEIARRESLFSPVLGEEYGAAGASYAAPGVVRQARKERGGWFEEEEVVFGARFLV